MMPLKRSASPLALLFLCLLATDHPALAQPKSALGPLPPLDPGLIASCDGCHGPDRLARDTTVPDIGAQPAEYLQKQLLDFMRNVRAMLARRDESRNFTGQRDNITMHPNAERMTETDALELGRYFSGRACTQAARPAANPAPVPAESARCVACHGADAKGSPGLVPRLAGQSSPYLFNQLNSMRRAALGLVVPGTASERSHPIMNSELKELEIVDLRALADYFASLPCR